LEKSEAIVGNGWQDSTGQMAKIRLSLQKRGRIRREHGYKERATDLGISCGMQIICMMTQIADSGAVDTASTNLSSY
jgi:hypothetical protein